MKIYGKVDGRQFTKARTVFYDNIEELRANQKTTFQEMDEARKVAENYLKRRGQPSEPKLLWEKEDGTQFETWLDAFIEEIFHRDSIEWYAAKIICAHERLTHSKNGKEVAAVSFQLGLLVAFMRCYQMMDVSSAKGGKNPKKKQWLVELVQILKEKHPGRSAEFCWHNFKNQINEPLHTPKCDWEAYKTGANLDEITGRDIGTGKDEQTIRLSTFKKYFYHT